MELIKSVEPAEVAHLEKRWGKTPTRQHRLAVDDPFLTGDHQLLVSDRRRAEICYIMHQGDPQQGVLLHIKTFYPSGAYRLPTGGIHEGEAVEETLKREIFEETGLHVGAGADQVQVQRFLGFVAYEFDHRTLGQTYTFATYHFLVQMPSGASLNPQDAEESIAGWQWRPAATLRNQADFLEQVYTVDPVWGDWGRYRALSHRFVAATLA